MHKPAQRPPERAVDLSAYNWRMMNQTWTQSHTLNHAFLFHKVGKINTLYIWLPLICAYRCFSKAVHFQRLHTRVGEICSAWKQSSCAAARSHQLTSKQGSNYLQSNLNHLYITTTFKTTWSKGVHSTWPESATTASRIFQDNANSGKEEERVSTEVSPFSTSAHNQIIYIHIFLFASDMPTKKRRRTCLLAYKESMQYGTSHKIYVIYIHVHMLHTHRKNQCRMGRMAYQQVSNWLAQIPRQHNPVCYFLSTFM